MAFYVRPTTTKKQNNPFYVPKATAPFPQRSLTLPNNFQQAPNQSVETRTLPDFSNFQSFANGANQNRHLTPSLPVPQRTLSAISSPPFNAATVQAPIPPQNPMSQVDPIISGNAAEAERQRRLGLTPATPGASAPTNRATPNYLGGDQQIYAPALAQNAKDVAAFAAQNTPEEKAARQLEFERSGEIARRRQLGLPGTIEEELRQAEEARRLVNTQSIRGQFAQDLADEEKFAQSELSAVGATGRERLGLNISSAEMGILSNIKNASADRVRKLEQASRQAIANYDTQSYQNLQNEIKSERDAERSREKTLFDRLSKETTKGITVSEGQNVVDPATGKLLYTAPAKSVADQQADNARSQITTILNGIKEGTIDITKLGAIELAKIEKAAGYPVGFLSTAAKKVNPKEDVISTQVDEKGDAYIVTRDKDGLFKTTNVGNVGKPARPITNIGVGTGTLNNQNKFTSDLDVIIGNTLATIPTKFGQATFGTQINKARNDADKISTVASVILKGQPAEIRRDYSNQAIAIKSIDKAIALLDEGTKTGLINNAKQYVYNIFGKDFDPKLTAVNQYIISAIQPYRNSITGAAWGDQEDAEYTQLFGKTRYYPEELKGRLMRVKEIMKDKSITSLNSFVNPLDTYANPFNPSQDQVENFSIQTPDGRNRTFDTQEQLDAFKQRAGL